MKTFKCKMEITILCEAETEAEATDIFGDAGVSVTNGDDGEEMYVEIGDWSVGETEA